MRIPAELRAWLVLVHDLPPHEDASARETSPVAERLVTLTRPLRPRFATVADCVVVHHPAGQPFAAACDDLVLVRADNLPGTLPSQKVDELPGWVATDPFPPDVAFTRGTDVLRNVLARAFEAAALFR